MKHLLVIPLIQGRLNGWKSPLWALDLFARRSDIIISRPSFGIRASFADGTSVDPVNESFFF